MKGLIALDIDGTITANHHHLEPEVNHFLTSLVKQEWLLAFITGRTFSWGFEVLETLEVPYYFAVHNGATILQMPARKIIAKQLISTTYLPLVDQIFAKYTNDYVIYTDEEEQPVCFYREKRMPSQLLSYLEVRIKALKEKWIPVDSFAKLPITEFSAFKYFGTEQEAINLSKELEHSNFHAPMIKDPYNQAISIIQATLADVNKGSALRFLKSLLLKEGVVIAAGDDNNDETMLTSADICVVMATGPKELIKKAHVIAPPAKEMGIIEGLTRAISLAKNL